jgi:hypothetical protein
MYERIGNERIIICCTSNMSPSFRLYTSPAKHKPAPTIQELAFKTYYVSGPRCQDTTLVKTNIGYVESKSTPGNLSTRISRITDPMLSRVLAPSVTVESPATVSAHRRATSEAEDAREWWNYRCMAG